ncbi:MAG: TonB family protein [Desulfosalsimonadaceae bacterium]|nr:TonB family protein [Desulfosalsimonadaceae bacterium]
MGLEVVRIDEDINKQININWLLVALVAVSIAIHAVVFLRMSGIVDFKSSSYIPISIRNDMTPPARAIPKPPARPPVPASPKPLPGMVPDQTVPSIAPVPEESHHIKPVEMPPAEALTTDSAPESSVAEDDVPEAAPDVVPGEAASSPSTPAIDGGIDPRMDYFNAVRLKIENHKAYPEIARKQLIEGVAVVAFVINPDGAVSGLTVASGSGSELLDAAAVSAVKKAAPFSPLPEKYFKGPAPVKIPIAFEIIR